MQKIGPSDPIALSRDLVADNIATLAALFPELITEGPQGVFVNVDVLKALVGDQAVTDADEKYGLNWHGKRMARQLALVPSTGTLRPCPEESVNWEDTQNIFIEGDNLEVLKLLQKSYAGKVRLIYIDPPYNTGKDFVYPDDFRDNIRNYLELTGQTENGKKISSNSEASGRFHTDWLNMMYPRLKLARELLRDDGVIVIHIDEHEDGRLVQILSDVFGEENKLGICCWDKRNPKGDVSAIAYQHESIVVFARNTSELERVGGLTRPKANGKMMLANAKRIITSSKSLSAAAIDFRGWVRDQAHLTGGEAMYNRLDSDGRVYRLVSMAWPNKKVAPDDYFIPLVHPVTNQPCPIPERGWRNPPNTMSILLAQGLIEFGDDHTTQPQRKYFLDENLSENIPSVIPFAGSDDALFRDWQIPFEHPKPFKFAGNLIEWFGGDNALILDFFAGSGTTGHAVMAKNAIDQGNCRYILVQLPEPLDPTNKDQKVAADFCDKLGKPRTIAELTKERLRRAGTKVRDENPMFAGDTGFRVFKLDHSNIRAWDPSLKRSDTDLLADVENIMPNRTAMDLLYEVLLKLGLDLCIPIATQEIAGHTVYAVGGGVLMACLDTPLAQANIEALGQGIIAWLTELAPAGEVTCIFRDTAFENDVAKTNLSEFLKQHKVQKVRSL